MNIKLIPPSIEYEKQITDMLAEWLATNEDIIPGIIAKADYHDFENYIKSFDIKNLKEGYVPSTTYFALDEERNVVVGAVVIRHYLNKKLAINGGHIGYGVRPSERRKGYVTKILSLALNECKKFGISKALLTCKEGNEGSRKCIIKNGGVFENKVIVDGVVFERYLINLLDKDVKKEFKIVLPDYKNSNCNLPNSILKKFGVKPLNDTLSLLDPYLEKDYKNVVLLLLDGMGKVVIEKHLKENGAFRTHLAGIYKAVFLSTTVAATTSVCSGLMPIEHCWFGMDCYYPSLDKNVTVFSNKIQGTDTQAATFNVARTVNPYESIVDKINKTKNKAYTIAPFVDDEITSIEILCDKIANVCNKPLENSDTKKFIYAYWPDPDTNLHLNGCNSKHVTNLLTNIENAVENLTQNLTDTLFIITADHGHIDTENVMIQDYPKIMNTLVRLPSFEPRALNLFVKKGMEEIFEEEFNKEFGDKFLLLTMEDVLKRGLLGTKTPHKNAKGMLGNYMAIAISDLSINFKDDFLVARHSGLTEDEMLIPLIIFS